MSAEVCFQVDEVISFSTCSAELLRERYEKPVFLQVPDADFLPDVIITTGF
jgi:hypothetical protein